MELDVLGLSTRTFNSLRRGKTDSVEHLQELSDEDLLQVRGLGIGGVREVRRELSRLQPGWRQWGNEPEKVHSSGRPRNAALFPLRCCPVCRSAEVVASYLEDRKYRYRCYSCKQYFDFNALSLIEADQIWNDLFVR